MIISKHTLIKGNLRYYQRNWWTPLPQYYITVIALCYIKQFTVILKKKDYGHKLNRVLTKLENASNNQQKQNFSIITKPRTYVNYCVKCSNLDKFDCSSLNKANLRDLIAATGLVILRKLDSNHRFFGVHDLQIWWMTSQNNRAPVLCYVKLCALFQSHQWIQTGVTVRKHWIQVKIDDLFCPVWP